MTCIAPKLLLWKFPQGSPARGAGAQRLRGCCDELSYEPLEKDQESGLSQDSNPSVTAIRRATSPSRGGFERPLLYVAPLLGELARSA